MEECKYFCPGIKIVKYGEDAYPKRLLNIENPPKTLYFTGKLPRDDVKSLAIVGARSCSEYGRYMASKIAGEMARAGVQIISGMAVGIDGIAQMSCVNNGGKSFGILGSGVDVCYPRANKELYEKLKNAGGIISEYPPGTKAVNFHFPQRNRIISGLADGLLVVEAKQKSGTFITVDAALSQGKDIFVVPGRATDPLSVGCNYLIKQGACPIQQGEDILEVLKINNYNESNLEKDYKKDLKKTENVLKTCEEKQNKLEREENMVYSCLDFDPVTPTEIACIVNMDIRQVSCILIGLEMKGYVREVGRNSYVRT